METLDFEVQLKLYFVVEHTDIQKKIAIAIAIVFTILVKNFHLPSSSIETGC